MMNKEKLFKEFDKFNLIKEKNSLDRIKFCWLLNKKDNEEYLDLHLAFIEKANRYFKKDLVGQFQFKKDREVVHYYLQKKLKENISDSLKETITEIIAELDFKTLEEYQDWIAEIKLGKRNDKMDFVYSIMKSPYVAYHYNLLKDKMLDDHFIMSLERRFDEHKEAGAIFLLDKLKNNSDVEFQGNIILMLGYLSEYNKKETLKYARELAESKKDTTRENAIIVLGWTGGLRELSILREHLLNDTFAKCRAWSAASFMQMWLRRKHKKLRDFAMKAYQEALVQETDYLTIATIIESIMEIEDKKFKISLRDLDKLNKTAIDKVKIQVIRYLKKNNKQ